MACGWSPSRRRHAPNAASIASQHLAIVRYDRVATFLLKKSPFTAEEVAQLRAVSRRARLHAPLRAGLRAAADRDEPVEMQRTGTQRCRLPASDPRHRPPAISFVAIRSTSADHRRPAVLLPHDAAARSVSGRVWPLHAVRERPERTDDAFAISAALVVLFVVGPLADRRSAARPRWAPWLVYFGALGAGFMLLEVALLQRFVLLLGHPVYSLTVTLVFAAARHRPRHARQPACRVFSVHTSRSGRSSASSLVAGGRRPRTVAPVDHGIPWRLPRGSRSPSCCRPVGILLGMALPGGMRLVAARSARYHSPGVGASMARFRSSVPRSPSSSR